MEREIDMPIYQCHKKVAASKIVCVEHLRSQGVLTYSAVLHLDCGAEVPVDANWLSRNPKVAEGGYFVQYFQNEDKYTSYSPSTPFEEGYTKVPMSLEELDSVLQDTLKRLNAPTSHIEKVQEEKRELDDKLNKLDAFMKSGMYFEIVPDGEERSRLLQQREHMHLYSLVLAERLEAVGL